jgi:hypothetical protein
MPALLYLVTHPTRGLHKIGITNEKLRANSRMIHWKQKGWTVVHRRHFREGLTARAVEQAVLKCFKDNGWLATQAPGLVHSSESGRTEIVTAALVSAQSIWDMVEVQAQSLETTN